MAPFLEDDVIAVVVLSGPLKWVLEMIQSCSPVDFESQRVTWFTGSCQKVELNV